MNNILCSAGKGELSTGACLVCALAGDAPCGYDYSLMNSLLSDTETEKRKGEIHVTDLTGCVRKAWYDKCSPSPEFPHAMLARWLGTGAHASIEQAEQPMMSELMVSEWKVSYDGITGRADIIYSSGRLVDIKTTRWLKPDSLPYGSHALQVNIYAYLIRKSKIPQEINRLQIQYIDMSGPSKCRKCKPSRPVQMIDGALLCPDCRNPVFNAHLGALLVDIPMMTDEEVEAQIMERKKELQASITLNDPPSREPGFLCAYCSHLEKCDPGSYE